MAHVETRGVCKQRLSRVVALALVPLLLAGCPAPHGKHPAPPPRAVTAEDVIGAWRYAGLPEEEGESGWIITVEFARDGTFRQTLVPPRMRNLIVQTGSWRVEGTALKLDPLIVWDEAADGHWARRPQAWPMVPSAQRPGALAIHGGLAADHSLDRELERISEAECRLLTSVTPAAQR